jgi:uncharacterized protein YbbK (DUF523 family)
MAASAVELGCWSSWRSREHPLRLGVSTCLLGENVRFDDARDPFVVETLGQWFEFVPVCPEMELGMGSPRPTVRLVDEGQGPRLVSSSTGEDFTERMGTFSERRVGELQRKDLDGYLLKKSSPTCGLERIRIYKSDVPTRRDARGLFAAALIPGCPSRKRDA